MFFTQEDEVIIRIWLDTHAKFGHASLQTRANKESIVSTYSASAKKKLSLAELLCSPKRIPGIYVSIYPKRPMSIIQREGSSFQPKTLAQDNKKYENNAHPIIVKLKGLDVYAIEHEYDRFQRGHYKFSLLGSSVFRDPTTHNCCSLVSHLLIVGGIKKYFSFPRELVKASSVGLLIGSFIGSLIVAYHSYHNFEVLNKFPEYRANIDELRSEFHPLLFFILMSVGHGIWQLPLILLSKLLSNKLGLSSVTSTNISFIISNLLEFIFAYSTHSDEVELFFKNSIDIVLSKLKILLICSLSLAVISAAITRHIGGTKSQMISSATTFALMGVHLPDKNNFIDKNRLVGFLIDYLTCLIGTSVIPKFLSFSGVILTAKDLGVLVESAQKKEQKSTNVNQFKIKKPSDCSALSLNDNSNTSYKKYVRAGCVIASITIVGLFAARRISASELIPEGLPKNLPVL